MAGKGKNRKRNRKDRTRPGNRPRFRNIRASLYHSPQQSATKEASAQGNGEFFHGLNRVLSAGGEANTDIPASRRTPAGRMPAPEARSAAKDLMSSFPVKRYVDSKDDFPLTIGGISLNNYNVYDSQDVNETSLFIGTKILGYTFLFTGDAGEVTEKRIIKDNPDLDCDILKVGHHGSETSSCMEFLKAVTPEVAIISAGRANSHGHPKAATLNRLKAVGAKIRRTDLEGTITYRGFA